MSRARVAVACIAVTALAVVLAVLSPLREMSGDTAPGRLGAVVLRCAGSFDLAHIDYLKRDLENKRTYYFVHVDYVDELTSLFGPVPAVIGSLAMLDVGEGVSVSDHSLRVRERCVGASLVGVAAVFLLLASLAFVPLWRATVAAAVAVLSFAGAATLGQGLWQAGPALVCLVAALTTLAWRETRPHWTHLTPALLLLAVMIRPTIAPLAFALGIAWMARPETPTGAESSASPAHRGGRASSSASRDAWGMRLRLSVVDLVRGPSRREWIIATAIALAAVAPLVAWNAVHLYSPLPLGQWQANQHMSANVFSLANVPRGIAGLLVSPARGILWFAPITVVGVVAGLRRRGTEPRLCVVVAGGVLAQLVFMALFFKWHGGQNYGPRLLGEATWFATFLAAVGARRVSALVAALALVTCVIGQIGLWRWRPEQWEARRTPELHPSAFWEVADSPILAAARAVPVKTYAHDVVPTNGLTCEHGNLRSW